MHIIYTLTKNRFISHIQTHIYKEIPGSKKAVDDILGVDFLLSKDSEGNIVYWGWYSLSHLGGQMERINIARGIRLRKENIQIGDEEICKKFFATTDQRFSFYYFGEIHATSKYLIPKLLTRQRNLKRDEKTRVIIFQKKSMLI